MTTKECDKPPASVVAPADKIEAPAVDSENPMPK